MNKWTNDYIPMIGSTISRYKILEKLGEGGMGIVYKAQDTSLNRTIALKFLPDRVNKDEAAKARFLQEAQAAAALNHPNICTIYGIEEQEGHLFISMEYIEGGTLREKLPFVKTDDALTIAMQIGEALQDAHAKGIVHRDIKADNIMLNAKGQAKVMDFGLAKLKGSLKLTRTSSTVGTLGYMAPEQIQGGEVDHRSDIFSFGVLLFEMLTGKLPFRGDHEAAMVYSIVNEEPESLQKYLPSASPELAHIIEKALEKDPAERYQTSADMVVDLRHVKKQSTKVSREFARVTGLIPSTVATPASSSAELSSASQLQTDSSFLSKYKWWIRGVAVALIALASLAVFVLRPWNSTAEINPGMSTRVLEIPLTDIGYHGLSGDGNWAAFPAKDAGGNLHVYFMNTSDGEPKAITTDTMIFVSSVDVSFDGSRVVYNGVTARDNGLDIFLTSALGGGNRVIVQGGFVPRWQPDGNRIFFLRNPETGTSKNFEYWSVNSEGAEERLEFIDSISVSGGRVSLSVSPDGKEVAWLRTFPDGKYQEVMIRNLGSGAERQLTFNKKNIDEVCWAFNNQILFSSNKSGNINLWMVSANGGEEVQITKGLGPDLGIKISADLKKMLYFESQAVGDFWIGSLESGTTRQITFDDRRKLSPSLSPDGKLIAFEMYSADPLTPLNAIYVSNRDGSNRRQLASSPGMLLYEPRWSPDGSRISYTAYNSTMPFDSSGANKAYVIDAVRTGAPKLIADGWPGGWLNADSLLLGGNGKTRIASLVTGEVKQFFEDSTNAFPVPGGKYVAYFDNHRSIGGYWIVEVDASFKRMGAARRLDDRKDGYTLMVVSRSRDFMIFKKPGGNLLKVWLTTGKEEPIPGNISNLDNAGNFSLNPETNELIYQIHRSKGKLVMIENLFK
jgi:serine/threonine protein kinase/Tol biopolymer transport system component